VLLLCLLFLQNYLYEKTFFSTLYLSLAISIKLIPVFLLLFLFCRREFKLIWLILFCTILIIFIPITITGEKFFFYYSEYITKFLFSNLSLTDEKEHQSGMFFSLIGLLRFTNSIIASGFIPSIICLFLISGFYLFMDKYIFKENSVIFFLYLLGFLLINPISETHHLVFVTPILFLIIFKLRGKSFKKNIFAYSILLISIILLFLGKTFHYLYFPSIISMIILFIKQYSDSKFKK